MSEIFYQKHLLSVQIFSNKIINTQIDQYQIQKKIIQVKKCAAYNIEYKKGMITFCQLTNMALKYHFTKLVGFVYQYYYIRVHLCNYHPI